MRQEAEIRHQVSEALAPGSPPVTEEAAALHVECIEAPAVAAHMSAWVDLCRRSLEPNVFLEPAFVLPLVQHMPARRPPRFLLVWERNQPTSFGRLVGLLALRGPSLGSIARGFTQELIALGTPLLDRDMADEAFSAMLTWLRSAEKPAAALVLRDVTLDAAFHGAALRCAPQGVHLLERRLRAILWRIEEGGTLSFGSAKRRKELRRQQRRLSERGSRSYSSARSTADVARAAERFLVLEQEGWKGKRGTALLADAASATFTRTMTRLMAQQGQCRIDAAEVDGRPVGMGIILSSADRAFFWKTTFDETLAQLSPGVQFAFDLTELQRAEPDIAATDSCALPDHSMINRLWHDRLAVGDLMIAIEAQPSLRFRQAIVRERLQRRLRVEAKRLHHWWCRSR